MRGISRKVEQLNEELCKATISDDGLTMKVVEVHSETMDTRIRAVDASHAIYTFSMAPRTIEGCEREYEVKVETVEECEGEDVVSLDEGERRRLCHGSAQRRRGRQVLPGHRGVRRPDLGRTGVEAATSCGLRRRSTASTQTVRRPPIKR